MADAYWRYNDAGRHQPAMPPLAASAPLAKRSRQEYDDMPTGAEMVDYYGRDVGRVGHYAIRDSEAINASYDHYLSNKISSFPEETVRPVAGGMVGVGDGRNIARGGGRQELLPPDASNTLYVEGLPANCSRREVSHVFRPFVGFREVRLVNKESRRPGGDPLILCFVDFDTPNQATIALETLQGYVFDQHDRESANLRLQFARFPGPRSGGGPRARR